jgi:hypothetical protein
MTKTKNLLLCVLLGAIGGSVILSVQIMLLIFFKEGHLHTLIEKLFSISNKPIEFLPCVKSLAEIQSPLTTLGVLICYYVLIGAIGGLVFWVLFRKLTNR